MGVDARRAGVQVLACSDKGGGDFSTSQTTLVDGEHIPTSMWVHVRNAVPSLAENNNAACGYDGGDCEWVLSGDRARC